MLNRLAYIVLVIPIILSCAHQLAPSGGPIDEVPPSLLYEYPKKADVSIPTDAKVELIFSEWIDPKSVTKSVTIFPLLEDGFDVKVSGKKVTIKPNKLFEDSTTYHIGLSTELSDVHNVNISKPLDIIFSTGPVIDTLSISGCIPDPAREKNQPRVALFKFNDEILNDTILLGNPSYLTQTDTLGKFEFTHIKEGNYFILGFIDNDKNNKLTAGSEKAFVFPNKSVSTESVDQIHLFYTLVDTSVNEFKSITAISPKLLTAELKKNYSSDDQLSYHNNLKISKVDTTNEISEIEETIYTEGSKKVLFKLKKHISLDQYSLTYNIKRPIPFYSLDSTSDDSSFIKDTLFSDTLKFNGTNESDSLAVKFKECAPIEKISINDELTLFWSDMVKPLFNRIMITDTSGDTTFLSTSKEYASETVLKPTRNLLAGTEYTLMITDSLFVDLNNQLVIINEPVDTSDTTMSDSLKELSLEDKGYITFTTISQGDICNSLSVKPICTEFNPKGTAIKFTYHNSNKNITTSFDSQNSFIFTNIPSGNGFMSWFNDINKNRDRDPGNLFPWKTPEFLYTFSDTVEARARWDLENLPLTECFICEPSEIPEETETSADQQK